MKPARLITVLSLGVICLAAGHGLDWLFVSLFVAASVFWFWRTQARPTPKLVVRLVVGAIAAMVTLALLQSINNRVFDPLLEPKPSQSQPTAKLASDGKAQARIIPEPVLLCRI